MNKISETESMVTIQHGGCTINLDKTTDIIDILKETTTDDVKIENIFTHFTLVSKFNSTIKKNILIDPKDFITEQAIKMLKEDYRQLKNIENQTHDICMAAIDICTHSFTYIRHQTPEICKYAIIKNPMLLAHITDQNYELCMLAVFRNGLALQHVKNKTQTICIEAYKQTPYAIQFIDAEYQTKEMLNCIYTDGSLFKYIKNQTPETSMVAIKINLSSFQYIINPTLEMWKYLAMYTNANTNSYFNRPDLAPDFMQAILDINPFLLQYFKDPTPEINLYAVKKNPNVIKFVSDLLHIKPYIYALSQNGMLLGQITVLKKLSSDRLYLICLEAVKQNGCALRYSSFTTNKEICETAIKNYPKAIKYLDALGQTEDLCLLSVSINGLVLKHVINKTKKISLAAVNNNGLALEYVDIKTEEICKAACANNGLALRFVEKKTLAVCLEACNSNIEAIAFVPQKFISFISGI